MPQSNSHKIYLGDCLEAMNGFETRRFDLIYLDPPFFTGRDHSLSTGNGEKLYQFSDIWEAEKDYINFMHTRIHEMRRILKSTGSIFVHCDSKASHSIRNILDDVFGKDRFGSEIIWPFKNHLTCWKKLSL